VALTIDAVTFDCTDPVRVATFWAAALAWQLDPESDADGALVRDPAGTSELGFQPVPEAKVVKNRVHIDVRPTGSMAAEVHRLEGLGASIVGRVDKEGSFWTVLDTEGSFWTVLQDPEGNELCVLRGPEDGWTPEG
jgi:predicted enzyme related to lactoylglutathione lyase